MARMTSEELGIQFEDTGKRVSGEELGIDFVSQEADQPAPLDPSQYTFEQHQQRSELGRQQGEKKSAILRNALEAHGSGYEEGGFGDFWLETDIANSDKFTEKRKKFKNKYPEGDIYQVPVEGNTVLVGRPNKGAPFKKIGGFGSSLTAALPEITGAVVGGLPKGAARGIAGTFAGSFGAEVGESEVERLRGTEFTDRPEVYSKAIGFGGGEAAIETGLRGLGFAGRLAKVAREADVPVERAMEAFIRNEDLISPSIGQIAESPLVRQMFSQVSGTSVIPKRLTTEQSKKLLDSFNKRMNLFAFRGMEDAEIEKVLGAAIKELDRIIKPGQLNKLAAGKDLQRGVEAFKSASRPWVDKKYAKAFEADNAVFFDISNVQDVVGQTVRKIESQGIKEGEDVVIRSIKDLAPELQRNIQKIMGMNPTVAGFKGESGFTQVKELRTQFYDLMHSDDPATRRVATQIYSELTNSMKKPVGGNEEFVRRFVAASKANAFRENILEKSFIANDLRKTSDPTEIAERYFRGDKRQELQLIKRIIPKERWETYQREFQNLLLRDPSNITSKMEKFDQKTLDVVIPRERQVALKQYEEAYKKIDQSKLSEIKKSMQNNKEKALRMVSESDVDEITEMVRLGGGRGSDFAESLREGIYYDVLNHSLKLEKGKEILDPSVLRQRIRFWKDQGKLKAIMTEKDWNALTNYERYSSMIEGVGVDTGGAIRAAQLASDVKKVWKPQAQIGASLTLGSDAITARVLAKHQNILNKIPAIDGLSGAKIRGSARALGALSKELQAPGDPAEEFMPFGLRENPEEGGPQPVFGGN